MSGNPTSPSDEFIGITPSDTQKLRYGDNQARKCKAIMVTVAGNVAVKNSKGDTVTLPFLASQVYPFPTDQILATGTTATGIFVIF